MRYARRLRFALLTLATVALVAAQQPAVAQEPTADEGLAAPGTAIAFISPSRENQQIRAVDPDGGNNRLIWAAPAGTPRDDGIGTLSWRPDATEIAFDSSHDGLRSLLVRDIYAVRPSGRGLRRLTAPPGPLNTDGLPTGTVVLRVENYAGGKELSAYVDGAPERFDFTAATNTAWVITYTNVPDLGPGVRQFARVFNRSSTPLSFQCWFDAAAYADVVPGQVVSAGTLSSLDDVACPFAFRPSWGGDGATLTYLYRDASRIIDRTNDIWQTSADPAPTTIGEQLLDMGQFVARDELFWLARGPAPARTNEVLFIENGATSTFIYRGPVNDLANATFVDVGRCGRTICKILDVAWLPDGSGFVFSRIETGATLTNPPPEGGAIYVYSFATQRATEVLRLPNEVIGRLSISPDGQSIAFERAPRLDTSVPTVTFGPSALCPCSLWVVSRAGSGLRQLVADGRAPAWSPTAPAGFAPLTPRVWLPQVRR